MIPNTTLRELFRLYASGVLPDAGGGGVPRERDSVVGSIVVAMSSCFLKR